MGVDDLTLGGVDDRVGDVAGPALGQGRQRDHRGGRTRIALACADQTLVAQFVEAQTRIGVNVSAVEAAQAVHRDGVGVVLLLGAVVIATTKPWECYSDGAPCD